MFFIDMLSCCYVGGNSGKVKRVTGRDMLDETGMRSCWIVRLCHDTQVFRLCSAECCVVEGM